MESAALPPRAAIRRASRGRLPVRIGHHDARARVTARCIDASLAGRPHGAAPAVDGRRRATVVDGRARDSALLRPTSMDSRPRGPRDARDRDAPPDGWIVASRRWLDDVRPQLLGLARTGSLRSRPRVAPLAPRRARVFPGERAAVLATRDPGVAGPGDLAALGDDSLPGARDVPGPAAGGHPDVFRSRDLPRILLAGRSGAGRGHH